MEVLIILENENLTNLNIYLQDSESALVTHADQTTHGQLEDHVPLKRDEIPHILQNEESWAVEVAVAQIGDDQRVAEGGILARIEAVHSAESLARRTSAQEFHLTLGRKLQPSDGVCFLSFDGHLQDRVAVIGEDGSFGIVQPECLCCGWFAFDGP